MSKEQINAFNEQEFDEMLDIKYSKYQIKFLLKLIQQIVHCYYFDKQSVDTILMKVENFLNELEDGKRHEKKRHWKLANYIEQELERIEFQLNDLYSIR